MIIVLLANGFEEIEALTPVDILRREGFEVKTVGIMGRSAVGAHGIEVVCDALPEDIDLNEVEMAVFPGGMPGALNLDGSDYTDKVIKAVLDKGGHLAAICAAPLVFGRRGLLAGKRATCFPGFESELCGALITDRDVVTDGSFTTGRGMTVSLEFARELNRVLKDRKRAADPFAKIEEPKPYSLPSSELLASPEKKMRENEDELSALADRLVDAFASLGRAVTVTGAIRGPRLTTFKLKPLKAAGISRITYYEPDLTIILGLEGLRIIKPSAGETTFSVEIPNAKGKPVTLRELVESERFIATNSKTAVCLGKGTTGEVMVSDISKMPHLIVAGATGMGKSVCINSIVASILYKASPDEVKLIMIDPKQVEFNMYNGIPHLLTDVITDTRLAVGALRYALDEMERRYELLNSAFVRNIDGYNEKVAQDPTVGKPLPKILIVIDELADIMLTAKDKAESLIMRIAQKARAAGIHLIIGTQRPSSAVLTGVIKANIPTRICFMVTSNTDSRTVIETAGAEKLLPRGDMLFLYPGATSPVRIHGAYISDDEIYRLTEYLRGFGAGETATDEISRATVACYASGREDSDDVDEESKVENYLDDEKFVAAAEIAVSAGKCSTSLLQRKLAIGYGKAARYIDVMCDMGIVSEANGGKPRDALITADELRTLLKQSR